MKYFFIFFFLFSLSLHNSFAQEKDSSATKKDTTGIYMKHRANRAALYSAVLPGLGQAYNKKYWKIPVLYAGFTSLALAIQFNNHQYQIFKRAYLYRVDDKVETVDDFTKIFPDAEALLVRKDYYRRTRDLMIIFSGVLYVLNIVDAYVDAQLSNFDISDNLSLHASPSIQPMCNGQMATGLSLSFNLKH